jgi:potassium efflux system protein
MRIELMVAARISCFLVLSAVLLAGSTRAAQGQLEPQDAAVRSETSKLPSTAVEAWEIPTRAQEVDFLLRAIRRFLEPDPAIARVERSLAEDSRNLRALEAQTKSQLASHTSIPESDDLQRRWSRELSTLDRWQRQVTERLTVIEARLVELRTVLHTWELIRTRATDEGFPQSSLNNIEATLGKIQQAYGQLMKLHGELLELQSQVAEFQMLCRQVLETLVTAIEEERSRLFSFDSPPLWAWGSRREIGVPLAYQLWERLRANAGGFVEYLRGESQRLLLDLLLYLVVVALLHRLGRQLRRVSGQDAYLAGARHVLSRPFSSALIANVIVASFIHTNAPTAWYNMMTLILSVALLRLLPGLLPGRFRAGVFVLVGLRMLEIVPDFVHYATTLGRLLLLILAGAMLGALFWFIRQLRAFESNRADRWVRSLLVLTRGGMMLLALAMGLNAIGSVSLAGLITTGVLRSIYAAMLLSAAVVVVTGTAHALLQTKTAQALHMVRRNGMLLLTRFERLLIVIAIGLWGVSSLSSFSLRQPLFEALHSVLSARAGIGELTISLGDIVGFVFVVWLSFAISRLVRFVFEEDVYPRVPLPAGVPATVSRLAHYAILILGFLFAAVAAGFGLDRIAVLAGAFGLGIGFGLQNIVNNFVSGLILLFERPVRIGDKVQIDNLLGEITGIGIRSSTLRTWEGAEVIVPNGTLVSSNVINWTLSDQRRRAEVQVGVAYGSDPGLVMDLLVRSAREHPEVLSNPAPEALFLGFGDSAMNFSLRAWVGSFDRFIKVRSDLYQSVNSALKEAGIEIPFPQRDLHLRSVSAEAGSLLAKNVPTSESEPAAST